MNNVWELILRWLVPFLCGGAVSVITAIITGAKQNKKKAKALEIGVQCLLRIELIHSYEKYMDKGYCPVYAREALKLEYESYHELGGNGIVTDLYNKVIALPTE